MRWSKKGLIVPAPPPLTWAVTHAALPVVEPIGTETIRVYFSTRDEVGRSSIARCEADLNGQATTFDPSPVLEPGPLGAFDDAGVSSSCLVQQDSERYLYYTGWTRGVSVPFYLFVGLAVSTDGGRTFEKVSSAPILERSAVDPYLTASPWVLVEGGLWRMWYVSGTDWTIEDGAPKHRYHIKYAESGDGVAWRRSGRVCIDYRDPSEHAISRPCVVRDPDRYRMWYASRGPSYRIGYAESSDGLEWERRDADVGLSVSRSGWDAEMIEYPIVFDVGGVRRMLYNGNGYGATGIGLAVLGPHGRPTMGEGPGPTMTVSRP